MATKTREHLIRDLDRTEAALVAAARSLVMERPYESIRVREIAEVVGCNHGLITHYFGTKLGLFTRVLKEIGDELNASIPQLETPRQLIDHPLTGTYWRLMAALLEAGLDPADALNAGAPGVNAIVRRGEQVTGRDLGKDRASVGFSLFFRRSAATPTQVGWDGEEVGVRRLHGAPAIEVRDLDSGAPGAHVEE